MNKKQIFAEQDKAKQDKIDQEAIDKEKKRLEDIQKIVNDATEFSEIQKLEREKAAALAELKLLEATWIEKARIAAYYENQIAGVKDKNADEDEKLAKLRTQQTLGDAKNTFNQIAQLAGEDSKVGKAMADSKRNYKRCTRCYECIYNCTKITNHIRFPSISYNTSKFSWFSSSKKYCSN